MLGHSRLVCVTAWRASIATAAGESGVADGGVGALPHAVALTTVITAIGKRRIIAVYEVANFGPFTHVGELLYSPRYNHVAWIWAIPRPARVRNAPDEVAHDLKTSCRDHLVT